MMKIILSIFVVISATLQLLSSIPGEFIRHRHLSFNFICNSGFLTECSAEIQAINLKEHEEKCSITPVKLDNGPWLMRTCVLLHRPILNLNMGDDDNTRSKLPSRRFLGLLSSLFKDDDDDDDDDNEEEVKNGNSNKNGNSVRNYIHIHNKRRSAGLMEDYQDM
jgi:hypothetical protein